MNSEIASLPFKLFATCPQFMQPGSTESAEPKQYLDHVVNSAVWCERYGFDGILIYADHRQLDGWTIAELVVQKTERLLPLVATQPVYMHPYTIAKTIATIGYLHGRQIFLNMIAGGFKTDLQALNDTTPHDERYDRLVEYSKIIQALLGSPDRISYDGKYYSVANLAMTPPVPAEIRPEFFVSGSSDVGLAAAKDIGATAIQYPLPPAEYNGPPQDMPSGIRLGVIARADADEAWKVAHERFSEDRQGEIAHRLAMKVSDSQWHATISDMAKKEHDESNPYWLEPYKHYKTFAPYLVGDYDTVAKDLARYVRKEISVFIVDIFPSEEEAMHTREAFVRAAAMK